MGVAGTVSGSVAGTSMLAHAAPSKTAPAAILEAGVHAQGQAMRAGKLTAHELASRYLARIAAIDRAGPRLRSVIEINPDALEIAREQPTAAVISSRSQETAEIVARAARNSYFRTFVNTDVIGTEFGG
ncbi:MAG: hypothetical protein RR983_13055, partial [Massilia sp.]